MPGLLANQIVPAQNSALIKNTTVLPHWLSGMWINVELSETFAVLEPTVFRADARV